MDTSIFLDVGPKWTEIKAGDQPNTSIQLVSAGSIQVLLAKQNPDEQEPEDRPANQGHFTLSSNGFKTWGATGTPEDVKVFVRSAGSIKPTIVYYSY